MHIITCAERVRADHMRVCELNATKRTHCMSVSLSVPIRQEYIVPSELEFLLAALLGYCRLFVLKYTACSEKL